MVQAIYDHYDFLRYLTDKRFPDVVLGDEAFTYAFEKLAQDDWRRVRAFKKISSFRCYLGCVWCRLLEDFAIAKFGKITPPQWIQTLGGVWVELFKLLCRRRFSVEESVAKITDQRQFALDEAALQKAADEILAKVPHCGRQVGPSHSMDDETAEMPLKTTAIQTNPGDMVIAKEKWMALKALAGIIFKPDAEETNKCSEDYEDQKLSALVTQIRKQLILNEEDKFILTTHFVDGLSITDIGKRLGRNQNQIHGQYRRIMERIRKIVPDLLAPYV